MKYSSIKIDSDVPFVVIGNMGSLGSGILIRSKIVDINLIGLANMMFNEGPDEKYFHKLSDAFGIELKYIWSSDFSFTNRKDKLLFCYSCNSQKESDSEKTKNLHNTIRIQNDLIKDAFNRFIENTQIELKTIMRGDYSLTSFTFDSDKILYEISPLLLLSK